MWLHLTVLLQLHPLDLLTDVRTALSLLLRRRQIPDPKCNVVKDPGARPSIRLMSLNVCGRLPPLKVTPVSISVVL